MEMLRLYSLDDLAGCPTDMWGILDPGLNRFDGDKGVRENGRPFSPGRYARLTYSHGRRDTERRPHPHPRSGIRRRMQQARERKGVL
jgi:hypothetical protein